MSAPGMVCHVKRCTNHCQDLLNCWNEDCANAIHGNCCKLLLDHHDIPADERPPGEVFCKKTCWNAFVAHEKRQKRAAKKAEKDSAESNKKKHKVPWEQDGSMAPLMDWLTTEGNYAAYSGATKSNNGTSKAAFHKQIAITIKEKVPDSEWDAKDVENKVNLLEAQFRKASDWKNCTGQGIDDPGSVEEYLKKLCRYYNELEPVMGDRPNAKPLFTNEVDPDDDDLSSVLSATEAAGTSTAIEESAMESAMESDQNETGRPTKKQRLSTASGAKTKNKKTGKAKVDDVLLSQLFPEEGGDFRTFRRREVEARELEVRALTAKAKEETDLIRIQKMGTLLKQRQDLLDSGVPVEQVDAYLPLPPLNKNDGDEGSSHSHSS